MEVRYKSRWWARCNHVCAKFGLCKLVTFCNEKYANGSMGARVNGGLNGER